MRQVDAMPGARERLACNLDALAKVDGAMAARLRGAGPGEEAFGWAVRASGLVGLVDPRLDGPVTRPWPPERQLEQVGAAMARGFDQRSAVVCLGVGDGHVLNTLAQEAKSSLGMARTVYVVEPDAALLRACLATHDWSGSGSPLTDPRFVWCVGPGWASQARRKRARPQWPTPETALAIGRTAYEQVGAEWQALESDLLAQDQATVAEITQRYAGRESRAMAASLARHPGARPGRVMLVTSRFTTVLQHSSRLIAEALESLGYVVEFLIEEADHLRVGRRDLGKAIQRFEPDAMFVLDHLRPTFGKWIPESLPLISWLQDDLLHLMATEAGASVNRRQVVFSHDPALYVHSYGYPAAQTLLQLKMARERPADTGPGYDHDIVFVSNAGQRPEEMIAAMRVHDNEGQVDVVSQAARQLVSDFSAGASFDAAVAVERLLDQVAAERGLQITPTARRAFAKSLFIGVVSPLYRQQAVRWALAAAEERGRTVSLFGAGWETNPEFAAHARGTVAYGPDLDELTARSRINLQVVPYNCLHQRLLDGVAAGGFFLIREHPSDVWCRDAAELELEIPQEMPDDAAVLAGGGALADRLRAIRARAAGLILNVPESVIGDIRRDRAAGLENRSQMLPRHDDVTFTDAASLRRQMGRWLDAPEDRAAVIAEQRAHVLEHCGHRAGMRNLMDRAASVLALAD